MQSLSAGSIGMALLLSTSIRALGCCCCLHPLPYPLEKLLLGSDGNKGPSSGPEPICSCISICQHSYENYMPKLFLNSWGRWGRGCGGGSRKEWRWEHPVPGENCQLSGLPFCMCLHPEHGLGMQDLLL